MLWERECSIVCQQQKFEKGKEHLSDSKVWLTSPNLQSDSKERALFFLWIVIVSHHLRILLTLVGNSTATKGVLGHFTNECVADVKMIIR